MGEQVTVAELLVVGVVLWALLDGARDLMTPRHKLMARQREKNWRRGITMRPGFTYIDPDGTRCMSPTGRGEDCSCDGTHIAHQNMESFVDRGRPLSHDRGFWGYWGLAKRKRKRRFR